MCSYLSYQSFAKTQCEIVSFSPSHVTGLLSPRPKSCVSFFPTYIHFGFEDTLNLLTAIIKICTWFHFLRTYLFAIMVGESKGKIKVYLIKLYIRGWKRMVSLMCYWTLRKGNEKTNIRRKSKKWIFVSESRWISCAKDTSY